MERKSFAEGSGNLVHQFELLCNAAAGIYLMAMRVLLMLNLLFLILQKYWKM